MADDRLRDAREDARSAVARYDSLSRNQLMDAGILKEHAVEIRSALDSLVGATGEVYGDAAPEGVEARRDRAEQALTEFEDPTRFDTPQHVRRACYVLRRETTQLLEELATVKA